MPVTLPPTQTRAVSRRNRHIAPTANNAVHTTTFSTASHSVPAWVSGYRAISPTPYTGVNFAIVANVWPNSSTGTNKPPANDNTASTGPRICITFSLGNRYPMNRPNAANTSAHTQANNPHATHADAGNRAPDTDPTANATTTDAAPSTIAI